jgi:hypothetical protein
MGEERKTCPFCGGPYEPHYDCCADKQIEDFLWWLESFLGYDLCYLDKSDPCGYRLERAEESHEELVAKYQAYRKENPNPTLF